MRAWLDAVRSLAPVDRLQALQEQLVRGVFLPADVLVQVAGRLADPAKRSTTKRPAAKRPPAKRSSAKRSR
jgi:hypothetical protein